MADALRAGPYRAGTAAVVPCGDHGPRAAGFAHVDDTPEIAVVTELKHLPSLETRLERIASAASELVPAMRPNIRITSPQQWVKRQTVETSGTHHNAWLAPDAFATP